MNLRQAFVTFNAMMREDGYTTGQVLRIWEDRRFTLTQQRPIITARLEQAKALQEKAINDREYWELYRGTFYWECAAALLERYIANGYRLRSIQVPPVQERSYSGISDWINQL